MFLDILILKIIFKNYYFHIFLNKKYFKKITIIILLLLKYTLV
jgi:hypothetical protein